MHGFKKEERETNLNSNYLQTENLSQAVLSLLFLQQKEKRKHGLRQILGVRCLHSVGRRQNGQVAGSQLTETIRSRHALRACTIQSDPRSQKRESWLYQVFHAWFAANQAWYSQLKTPIEVIREKAQRSNP